MRAVEGGEEKGQNQRALVINRPEAVPAAGFPVLSESGRAENRTKPRGGRVWPRVTRREGSMNPSPCLD